MPFCDSGKIDKPGAPVHTACLVLLIVSQRKQYCGEAVVLLHLVSHCCSMGREGKLEQREQAAQGMQAEALALKAELHRLAEAMQSQADKQVTDAAEEKQALARHQARLDTLQVCCLQAPNTACDGVSFSVVIAPSLSPDGVCTYSSMGPSQPCAQT